MSKERKAAWRIAGGAACTMMVAAAPFCVGVAQAADYNFYGDVSLAMSWNTQDTLKENKTMPGSSLPDTKGKMSMERFTARFNLDSKVNDSFSWAGKVRLVREMPLGYLDTLQNITATPIGAANGGVRTLHHNDLAAWLSKSELRELYADINFTDNVMLRFGKQQVAWGESDFFAAMDMVHGFDWTWRSFLEPANEDLRKPLVLANLSVKVPELDGKVQVLFRPGKLNKLDSIGNSLDFQGGRWMPQPLKGIDFQAVTPWNYKANGADSRDNTWGVRWSAIFKEINYSVSYLKTFQHMPVISMNPNLVPTIVATGVPAAFLPPYIPSGSTPWKGNVPIGISGELVFPKVDLFGATVSGYSAWADAVFSAEVVYIQDYAYNYGQTSAYSPARQGIDPPAYGGPGYDGVKQKNIVRSMLRMDKSLPFTQALLGTEKPAFFSLQYFDTWIKNFKQAEDIVQMVGFGVRSREHSGTLTMILDTSYANGQINPSLVAGIDPTYGGGFLVPAVAFQYGKNWRLKFEYDHFWARNNNTAANNNIERNASVPFSFLENNDQFYVKLTYQF